MPSIAGISAGQTGLIERSEWALYKIDIELQQREPRFTIIPALGDVTDAMRMRNLFEEFSARRHLACRSAQTCANARNTPREAVKNNIFGTALMTDLAHEYEAGTFVQISTDKAVNPTSIMGVTKHICEEYVHAMSTESNTRCMVVRFGNVLGSSGSVVPLFQEQIRAGGPITVTHPEMKRFFMAIPEAAQLVLQAAAMGRGGEIFVLEMGNRSRSSIWHATSFGSRDCRSMRLKLRSAAFVLARSFTKNFTSTTKNIYRQVTPR